MSLISVVNPEMLARPIESYILRTLAAADDAIPGDG